MNRSMTIGMSILLIRNLMATTLAIRYSLIAMAGVAIDDVWYATMMLFFINSCLKYHLLMANMILMLIFLGNWLLLCSTRSCRPRELVYQSLRCSIPKRLYSGSKCRLSSPIELSFVSTERSGFNPHGSPSSGIQSEVDRRETSCFTVIFSYGLEKPKT
jgi:hypothetical protein